MGPLSLSLFEQLHPNDPKKRETIDIVDNTLQKTPNALSLTNQAIEVEARS